MFAETAAKVLAEADINVYLAKGFVSTPMVSLGVVKQSASLGIVITASHNPPSYNGYKLKGNFGGPLLPDQVQEVEDLIPDSHGLILNKLTLNKVEYIDLEGLYVEHAKANFDLDNQQFKFELSIRSNVWSRKSSNATFTS